MYRNIPLEERFLVLLLITAVAPPHASADPTTDSSSSPSYYPYGIDSSFNSSMKYILAVLIIGMFFVAFFLFYLRQCLNDGVSPPTATSNNRQQFACGLDSSVVNSFPVFLYSAVKGVKIGDEVLECAVCISEFEDDESLRLLPKCHHVFHPDCIDAWLASHSTCPVCRANLAPEKLAGDSEQTHELSIQSPEQRSEPRSDSSELPEVQNQVVIDVERETTQTRRNSRFPRSHSTGHSLVRPGENCERYTLRLPEEVRIRKQNGSTLKRAKSCDVVLAAEGSSRRGRRGNQDRLFGRSDRWMFTMTPPFIAKTGSIGKGDVAQSSSCYPV